MLVHSVHTVRPPDLRYLFHFTIIALHASISGDIFRGDGGVVCLVQHVPDNCLISSYDAVEDTHDGALVTRKACKCTLLFTIYYTVL